MNQPEAILHYFEKLSEKHPNKLLLCKIRWAAGGGMLMISRLEWEMNPERSQRLELIKVRLNTLWRHVRELSAQGNK